MNVSEFLFEPLRKLVALTASSSEGFHLSYGLYKKVTPFVCFEPVAFMIHLIVLILGSSELSSFIYLCIIMTL